MPESSVLTNRSLLPFAGSAGALFAQGNYDVQVYGSELVPPGRTMFELHTNFTFEGSKIAVEGVRAPTSSPS